MNFDLRVGPAAVLPGDEDVVVGVGVEAFDRCILDVAAEDVEVIAVTQGAETGTGGGNRDGTDFCWSTSGAVNTTDCWR